MRIAVVGVGAVGARAARQLASTEQVAAVLVTDLRPARVLAVTDSLGSDLAMAVDLDIEGEVPDAVILAAMGPDHVDRAAAFMRRGAHVVSVSDSIPDVEGLLDLDAEARERGRSVVIGAGFSPGLTCLLARHAAAGFDHVDEIHLAKVGTGGPDCARQHHRALAAHSVDWRDRAWVERRGGSGRELCWFPDPVGARDCYRAGLPDALLLVRAFPGVTRVTARMGANRRDRITARVPMLRKPHPEGGPGAVRVEVRGERGEERAVHVLGAMDRPAVAAGAVAALAAVWAIEGRFIRPGAGGLAELTDPLPILAELARRGVKAAVFEGAAAR